LALDTFDCEDDRERTFEQEGGLCTERRVGSEAKSHRGESDDEKLEGACIRRDGSLIGIKQQRQKAEDDGELANRRGRGWQKKTIGPMSRLTEGVGWKENCWVIADFIPAGARQTLAGWGRKHRRLENLPRELNH